MPNLKVSKSENIETWIKYGKTRFMQLDGISETIIANPFIRKDYHEDGSVSTYYGLEMTRKNFKRLKKAWKKI
jgi:hypothetical protein